MSVLKIPLGFQWCPQISNRRLVGRKQKTTAEKHVRYSTWLYKDADFFRIFFQEKGHALNNLYEDSIKISYEHGENR